jgi:hypothetical protein
MMEIEEFWDYMLSRETAKITIAFQSLSKEDQKNIHNHLISMVFEDGWLPEQRDSAEAALSVIEKIENS